MLSLKFIFISCFILVIQSRISKGNKDYIVVSISNDITIPSDPNEGARILTRIQEWITSGSRKIYDLTEGRYQIPKNVKILVPSTWPTPSSVTQGAFTHFDAEIRVEPKSGVCDKYPRTIHLQNYCGTKGEYILLPKTFLDKQDKTNDDRIFAYEWIKYFFGSLDQYGCPRDEEFPAFYLNNQGANEPIANYNRIPNGASKDIFTNGNCGKLSNGQYNENCTYIVDHSGPNDDITSYFMTYPTLKNNLKLNKGNNSNPMIKTPHNFFCCGKSVWTMIQEHKSTSTTRKPYVPPTYEVIKPSPPRIVFVIDNSGSMQPREYSGTLKHATKAWLQSLNDNIVSLGLVTFNSKARSVMNVININKQNLGYVQNNIDNLYFTGRTNIASGIRLGLSALRRAGKGGIMVLLTDGENNVRDNYPEDQTYIDATKNEILASKVKIITVAFGQKADKKLEQLAQLTNGVTFYATPELSGVNDIVHSLSKALDLSSYAAVKKKIVNLGSGTVHSRGVATLEVNIDDSIGPRTQFIVTSQGRGYVSKICIGTTCQQANRKTVVILTKDLAPGAYTFTIHTLYSTVVSYAIISSPSTADPIHATCEPKVIKHSDGTSTVLISSKVLKGYKHILNANVRAYIETDGLRTATPEVNLLDNGLGLDKQKNDGIYTGSFINLGSGDGSLLRFKVKCKVSGGRDSYTIDHGTSRKVDQYPCCESRDSNPKKGQAITSSFTRQVPGGSFGVNIPAEDKTPPAMVRDVTVKSTDTSGELELSFTAMGDDNEHGTAAEYVITYSDDIKFGTVARLTQSDLIRGSLDTVPAGTKFSVIIPARFENYYFMVKTVDRAGNAYKICNKYSNFGKKHKRKPKFCKKKKTYCSSSQETIVPCVTNFNDCERQCTERKTCTDFSYNQAWKICKLMDASNSNDLTCTIDNDGFESGTSVCVKKCFEVGKTLTKAFAEYTCIPNYLECQKLCQKLSQNCKFFSYASTTKTCKLHASKTKDKDESGSIYATRDCDIKPPPKL